MSGVEQLEDNPRDVYETAVRLLLTVADNILSNRSDIKYRRLKLANKSVSEKLLPATGAMQCLFEMGFDEGDDSLVLAMSTPLDNLMSIREKLARLQDKINSSKMSVSKNGQSDQKISKPCSTNGSIASTSGTKNNEDELTEDSFKVTTFQPITSSLSPTFLRTVESYAHKVLQYESKALQARARRVVPIEELWTRAQKTLRNHQVEKVGVEEAEDKGLPDLLLYELLQWFKYEFFSWVDKPDCIQCKAKTTAVGMSTRPEHLKEAGRTELYVCPLGHETPFHRYNNPAKLLQTRRGRCGEWANCFTLICRALDMDARLVHDETDHVWTEVWSVTQQRWIHCDACEAIMDSPYTYQAGWGKKLTYVIAFSKDDVQDVTWKYTQEPIANILQRRNLCTEKQLQNLLNVLRFRLQEKVSPARKAFLQNRQINELMSMICVPGSQRILNNTETQGRVSGSAEWRQQRKETGQINSNWIWRPSTQEIEAGKMQIKFSAAQNLYVKATGERVNGWASGVKSASNISRKVERDWKMVYLARSEGTAPDDVGSLEWRIEVPKSHKIGAIELDLPAETYENGKVRWKICGENPDLCFMVPHGQLKFASRELSGCSSITIRADLAGGSGNCAWQHAQVSRQVEDDGAFPLQFTIEIIP